MPKSITKGDQLFHPHYGAVEVVKPGQHESLVKIKENGLVQTVMTIKLKSQADLDEAKKAIVEEPETVILEQPLAQEKPVAAEQPAAKPEIKPDEPAHLPEATEATKADAPAPEQAGQP